MNYEDKKSLLIASRKTSTILQSFFPSPLKQTTRLNSEQKTGYPEEGD